MITANVYNRVFFIKAADYGTAFSIDHGGRQYLVTAKHLVNAEKQEAIKFFFSERLTIAAFCDQFSRYIAHHYHAGQLDFSVADTAMNALHAYVGNTYDVRLPSYAWEVFMAFDDGEHYHAHDLAGTDPEVKYTRAQIASLVIRESVLGWSGAER